MGSPAFRQVLGLFLVSRGILYLCLAYLSQRQFPGRVFSIESLLLRADAREQLRIAADGYTEGRLVHFPLYPILTRFVAYLVDPVVAGLLVSNFAFLLALYFMYRVVENAAGKEQADDGVAFVAASPIAFFCALPTPDALLLMLLAVAFYGWGRNQPLVAGFFGMFAALTHIVGVLLFFGMAFATLSKSKWNVSALHARAGGLLLIPLGLAFYMTYAGVNFGDAMAVLPATARMSVTSADLMDIAAVAIAVPLTIIVSRDLDPAYATFTVLMVLVPLVFGRGFGLMRAYFVIVPFFITLATYLRPRLVFGAAVLVLTSLQIAVAVALLR